MREHFTRGNIGRALAGLVMVVGGLGQGAILYQQNSRIDALEKENKTLIGEHDILMGEARDSSEVLCAVTSLVGQAILGMPPLNCAPADKGVSGQLPVPEPTLLPIPHVSS